MARLLHFAGCTLASLHPDPLSSFTPRTVEPDDEDDDDDAPKPPNPAAPDPEDTEAKGVEFAKYAEAYYTTLNVRLLLPSSPHPLTPSQEIQLSLRTSIRHLRLSRASPAPILDPSFASLANPGGGGIGVGGVALGEGEGGSRMSVAAMKLEQEAWKDLGQALGKGEG